MCEELHLERFDDSPWGFRLTGGFDFGTPLTVVKVTGGSISEEAGVQVGDIVVEINGKSAKGLTHTEAQQCISISKGQLNLTVMRGSFVTPPSATPLRGMTPRIGRETSPSASTLNTDALREKLDKYISEGENEEHFLGAFPSGPRNSRIVRRHESSPGSKEDISMVGTDPQKMSEDELVDLMTGNEEVLNEEGVIGINFQKFLPQVDFIRQSEVFKFLQNENTHKEISEQVQLQKEPTKRFSTFLMKPRAPPEKPKGPQWIHPKAPRYLPRDHDKKPEEPKRRPIPEKAQPPKDDSGHTVLWLFLEETGEKVIDERWGNEEEERINLSRIESRSEDIKTPFSEAATDEQKDEERSASKRDEHGTDPEDEEISQRGTEYDPGTEGRELESRSSGTISVKEKNEVEKQLEEIQAQLIALEGRAPSDLVTRLAAIQEQLKIIATMKITETEEKEEIEKTSHGVITEKEIIEEEGLQIRNVHEQWSDSECDEIKSTFTAESEEVRPSSSLINGGLDESDEVHAFKKGEYEICEAPAPPKKAAHPLTPQMRPIVLPGGRMWRQPKDAAHEEFYTGVLVAQAEVLVGSTEKPVNFTKYVPPKFDMSHSEVYRLIHDIEDKTKKHGHDEKSYYNTPIGKRHFYAATLREPPPIGEVELKDL